jgi:hypothetical protein
MSTETLRNKEECTIDVDEIDVQARKLIYAAGGTIETIIDRDRRLPFHADRFRVVVPIGTTQSGADTIMAILFLEFPNGERIRLIPEEFTVALKY